MANAILASESPRAVDSARDLICSPVYRLLMPTTLHQELTIYVIDDDQVVLQALVSLLETAGYQTRGFTSAESFLAEPYMSGRGCVVTDLRLEGMSGQDLQKWLVTSGNPMPLIVVTGHATVDVAVEVMETGAVTLLQKPYQPELLIAAVKRAIARANQWSSSSSAGSSSTELAEFRRRMGELSQEERRVMLLMVGGLSNKAISAELACSMRTVDRRRSRVLEKLGVQTVPELARLCGALEQDLVSRPS